jgi:uncharacterized protein YqeY
MNLKERLRQDLADAMRSGETERRDVLRLLVAAIKQEEVDQRQTLEDAQVQEVLVKQAKQRRESIADAERAGRADLVEAEERELAIIEEYLPQQMSRDEVEAAARQVIDELGVQDMKGMGQVMSRLMPQLKGQADGRVVSDVVRDLLA